MDEQKLKQYWADSPPSVVRLEIKSHFDALTEQQKLYAHRISRAAFHGTRVILRQVSPESEAIFDLILAIHRGCEGDYNKLQQNTGVSTEDVRHFQEYSTQFLYNAGNYKGFGDSKFIPRLSPSAFSKLASSNSTAKKLFEALGEDGAIFATKQPGLMHLGFPDKGHLSTYYPDSPDITQAEIESIGEFLADKGLLPENTRLRKLKDGTFQVLVASGVEHPPAESIDVKGPLEFELKGNLEGKKLSIVFGDYKEQMAKIAHEMKQAAQQTANERQQRMMTEYATSFATGSLLAFKESQKLWVKDIGPAVDCNIGFIESYRDPASVRSEWEGFVAIVNQERTRAFEKLVSSAPSMIPKLPWGKEFEKDVFQAPDFTSLEVLSFASSGIPAGINIPNYDDIRMQIGFKNVSLGNILNASLTDEEIPFIHPDDLAVYTKNRDAAFEVQVGIHELLGHGSGKLLSETSPGVYNFDHKNPPVSPVDGKAVSTYYKVGQTWSSVFGNIAPSYEECRAEAVAMALGCDFDILAIFGFGDGTAHLDGKAGDVLHAAYLNMARAGLTALEFWDPGSRKWGQAHMQARFSILRVFLEAGQGFTTLEHKKADLSDLVVRVDRSKILTVGRLAVEKYLQKLHVYKASADVAKGRALYEATTEVDGWWGGKVREVVLANKRPRKVFVQANTVIEGGRVVLKEYEPTLEGMIRSWAEREV